MDEGRCSLELDGPYDLVGTLRPLADGFSDPTWSFGTDGRRCARTAAWTPLGAATVRVTAGRGAVHVVAVGPGTGWVLERSALFTGLADDTRGFRSHLHPTVADLHRRAPGRRLARSLGTWSVMVPTVLGQRVTTTEARRSWRRLVALHGHPAPGDEELRLPPRPEHVARLGDADWHAIGVERSRAEAARGLIRVLSPLDRLADEPGPPCPRRTGAFRETVESVRRAGPWTSTALASAVLGDPDVVLLGDLHLPATVCAALAGEPGGDDARMLELLEPFRPHRGRVQRLVKASGRSAPRRGPRYAPLPLTRM